MLVFVYFLLLCWDWHFIQKSELKVQYPEEKEKAKLHHSHRILLPVSLNSTILALPEGKKTTQKNSVIPVVFVLDRQKQDCIV